MNLFQKTTPEPHLLTSSQTEPGSWKSVFLAGLPHFLMGLLVAVGLLFSYSLYDEPQSLYMIIAITLACVVVGTLLAAWWLHWPLWSASWYLYGAYVILVIVAMGIEKLGLEESWRYTNALLFGWVALYFLGYLFNASRSKMHALLSIVMLFPLFGSFSVEFIPNRLEGFTTFAIGILAAVSAGTMVRLNDFKKALWVLVVMNLFAGVWLAYIGEYHLVDFPPGIPVHVPEFRSFLQFLVIYCGISAGVIALPFLLQGIKNKIIPKAAS